MSTAGDVVASGERASAAATRATIAEGPAPRARSALGRLRDADFEGFAARLGRRRRRRRVAALETGALAVALFVAVELGAVGAGLGDLAAALAGLAGGESPAGPGAVLVHVRLPRVLLAAAVGGTLGLCGAALQGLFRNPLADPSLLGMSAGAAAAVVSATVLVETAAPRLAQALGAWLLPASAFVGALATIVFVHRLAVRGGRTVMATMLLAGVGVNALAGALTGLMLFVADDAQLRSVTFWSLGSLAGASWRLLAVALPFLLFACWRLPRLAVALDALTLGEAEASDLGVDVEALTRRVLVAVSLGTAAAVSVAGTIGFVGLAAPHLVRLLSSGEHRVLLPSSLRLGALLLVAADLGARTIAAPAEVPIGVLTALGGAPMLLWLLQRGRREAS